MAVTCSCKLSHQPPPSASRKGLGVGQEKAAHRAAPIEALRPRALSPDLQGLPETMPPASHPRRGAWRQTTNKARLLPGAGQQHTRGPPAVGQALKGYRQLRAGQDGRGEPSRNQSPTLSTKWLQRTAVDNKAWGGRDWRTETKQPDCQLDFHVKLTACSFLGIGTVYAGGASGKRIRLPMQEIKETRVQSFGQEDPLEEETATHFSILAWRTGHIWATHYFSSNTHNSQHFTADIFTYIHYNIYEVLYLELYV